MASIAVSMPANAVRMMMGRPGRVAREPADDLEPVHVGHAQVDDGEIDGLARRDLEAGLPPGGRAHGVAVAVQHLGEKREGDRIVVGDEQGRRARGHPASPIAGRQTRKTLPWPGALSTSIAPL